MERTRNDIAGSPQVWAISDGRAGNARQADALADALAGGMPVRQVVLSPHAPWRWAAPRRWPGSVAAFGAEFAALMATPPRLAIGCGRQAALATRLLRDEGAKTVQVLDPRIDPAHWDVVVVPGHDALRSDNVVTALGSLHPVDDAWLAQAREAWPAFATLPQPRTAVLLGGGSRHARFDVAQFERMAALLESAHARDGGSLLLTASRRSPEALRAAARARFTGTPGIAWCGLEDGPNPYPGLLAWADRIACSPDSVNMVSEACATRAPVFVFEPAGVEGGPRRFLDALLARGRIRAMDGALDAFDAEPLRETARVAVEVDARLEASEK